MREETPGVFVSEEEVVVIGKADISILQDRLSSAPLLRNRILAHKGDDSAVHEMIITLSKGTKIRAHKHPSSYESMHVISGEVDVNIFDDSGKSVQVISMGTFESGKPFYYRLPPDTFHTVIPRSETVSIHEVIQGPFTGLSSVFAPWS